MRRGLLALAILLVSLSEPGSALADPSYPSRAIKLVVPFPPGGTVDIIARTISSRLSERLGQPVVIENKGGAGGMVGTAEVAHATPDGYTLVLVFDSHAVNHHLYSNIGFDTFADFTPISHIVSSPMTLVASKQLKVSNLSELLALARSKPGGLSCANAGAGSSNHLAMMQLENAAGFKCNHVTYRGAAPMVNDLIGGHVDMAFNALPAIRNQILGNNVVGIALASPNAMSQLPNVEPIATTYPNFVVMSWIGLLAPARTPQAIIDVLYRQVTEILSEPEIRLRLEGQGFVVESSTPDALLAHIRTESDTWGAIIRAAGLQSK